MEQGKVLRLSGYLFNVAIFLCLNQTKQRKCELFFEEKSFQSIWNVFEIDI